MCGLKKKKNSYLDPQVEIQLFKQTLLHKVYCIVTFEREAAAQKIHSQSSAASFLSLENYQLSIKMYR